MVSRVNSCCVRENRPTLLLSKMNGILLRLECYPRPLHIIGTEQGDQHLPYNSKVGTHELAQPIRGFSQRPPPWRMSKSIRQRSVLAVPLCIVFRAGWKMRTARCLSCSATASSCSAVHHTDHGIQDVPGAPLMTSAVITSLGRGAAISWSSLLATAAVLDSEATPRVANEIALDRAAVCLGNAFLPARRRDIVS